MRKVTFGRFCLFLILMMVLEALTPNFALCEQHEGYNGAKCFYEESEYTVENMVNLMIHYIGYVDGRQKGVGLTNNNTPKFEGWIPIYDVIDNVAYFPSSCNIYMMNVRKFEYIEPVGDQHDIIAAYRTVFFDSSKNRKFNIKKAAEAVNGVVIMAGEKFSYNSTTGPRDEDSGYKLATVISHGEYVEDYGGGVCQVSSTIYAAVKWTPKLQVKERHPHSLEVSYIPEGLDATVSYTVQDFVFKNKYRFDICIKCICTDDILVVLVCRN